MEGVIKIDLWFKMEMGWAVFWMFPRVCLDFPVDCGSELEREADIASAKCIWLAP